MRGASASSGRLANLAIASLLAAAAVAIYAQTARFGAIRFDDPQYVAGSRHLQEGLSLEGLRWAFTTNFGSNYFPLTLASHMLDRSVFGDALGGHHLTSVALHALNSVLLYFALLALTRARWPSAVVALLFAVHPLNVESVAWIAERKNVLSATFWMLSMWAYAGYARRGSILLYLCVALLLALGLLAKPVLVTLPLVFLLLDYWPLDRIRWGEADAAASARRSVGYLIAEKVPLLAICALSSIATLNAQSRGIVSTEAIPIALRVANALVAYALYLGKIVWPANLAMHYPHPYMPEMGGEALGALRVGAAALLLLALSALAVAAARRRHFIVGWLWFLGVLVPTIGLVQVGNQALADRYAYVPAIGVFVALSWAGSEWFARVQIARVRLAVQAGVGMAIAALAVAAWHQAGYWRDTVSLFEHALAVAPKNPKIRYNLANEYSARGDLDAAIRNYRIALETDTASVNTRVNLANALRSQRKLDEAVEIYEAALKIDPDDALALNGLGTVLRAKGDPDGAIVRYRAAIAADPDYHLAHYNLANALQAKGELEEAARHYIAALARDASDPKIFNNLGNTFWGLERFEDAETAYRAAIALDARHFRAQNNLGLVLARRGAFDEAITHYRLAIAASPDYASAHYNLGDALRALGDLDGAVAAYSEALRAEPGHERARESLGAARAERERLRE